MFKLKLVIVFLLSSVCLDAISQKVIIINRYYSVAVGDVHLKNKNKENITYLIRGFNPFGSKLNGKGASIEIPAYKTPDIFSDITAKALTAPTDTTAADKINTSTPKNEKPSLIEDQSEKFITCYTDFITSLQTIYSLSRMEDRIISVCQDPQIDSITLNNNLQSYINSVSPTGNPRVDITTKLNSLNKTYSCLKFYYDALSKTLSKEEFTFKGKITDEKNEAVLNVNEAKAALDRKKYFVEEYNYATLKFNQLNTDSIRTAIINKVQNAADIKEKAARTPFTMIYEPGNDFADGRRDTIRIESLKGELIQSYGPYAVYRYGQLKVDISGGYLLAFGGDKNYSKTYDASGNILGVQKANSDKLKQNIGILFHAYPKAKGDVALGIGAGFSIPVESSISFFVGPSLLFNGKTRFVITAGICYLKLKELNKANLKSGTSDENYEFTNRNITDILYDNVYRPRPFIGITYNLFALK